jgi:hypothetical protein
MSRIVDGTVPIFLTVSATSASDLDAQFIIKRLSNGKYALKAEDDLEDNLYISRRKGCSPGSATPDTVTVKPEKIQRAPYAQWRIITVR